MTVYDNGTVDAVELSMVVTGKNRDGAGKRLRDLKAEIFNPANILTLKLPGEGNKKTKIIDLRNAIELVMVLPGKSTKMMRKKFAEIITRYLDGDTSMCYDEMVQNTMLGQVKSHTTNLADRIISEIKDEERNRFEMPMVSYVYATKSPAFWGLIHISKTINVRARSCDSLTPFCAPAPYVVVVAVAPTLNNDRDEKAAHLFFANFRREGFFFEVSEEVVKAYFTMRIMAQFHIEMSNAILATQGAIMQMIDSSRGKQLT